MCSTEVGYGYKSILQIKRGKIAFCQASPLKFAVRIFRKSEQSERMRRIRVAW